MKVGMNQLLVFTAGRADRAAVVGPFVFAIQVLRIGQCQCQATASGRAQEQLRMAHTVVPYRLN